MGSSGGYLCKSAELLVCELFQLLQNSTVYCRYILQCKEDSLGICSFDGGGRNRGVIPWVTVSLIRSGLEW